MSDIASLQQIQRSASMTQLPPSPDQRGGTGGLMPEFSLDDKTPGKVSATAVIRRLRSVARYQSFSPQALACSNVLASANDDHGGTTALPSASALKNNNNSAGPSSLGAIAGPQGVALFRLSRPHVPLLILSHATNAASSGSISSLAFEPKHSQKLSSMSSLYLAATRGSGVLVWEASGHSPNPLLGRVGMDQAFSSSSTATTGLLDDDRVTSISWKSSATSLPLLASTTPTSLLLWDLRASASSFKTSIRFGTNRKVSATPSQNSPLVQVACSSDSDECATIDASGIVRIYDVRMNDRGRHGSPLSTFVAHESVGVGIEYLGLQTSSTNSTSSTTTTSVGNGASDPMSRWLTWGLDAPMSSAVIKVWTKTYSTQDSQTIAPMNQDDYWYAPNNNTTISPLSRNSKVTTLGATHDFVLTAQCTRPNLACARVCASEDDFKIMAIGHLPTDDLPSTDRIDGWWAELYSLINTPYTETANAAGESIGRLSFGMEKEAGFHGGDATSGPDKGALASVLGNRTKIGNLQAAELGLSSIVVNNKNSDTTEEDDGNMNVEVLLCCLSDAGVITTHAVPEVLSNRGTSAGGLNGGKESPKQFANSRIRTGFSMSNQARIFPDDREGRSLFDAASFWGTSKAGAASSANLTAEGRQNSRNNLDIKDRSGTMSRHNSGEGEGPMPFDVEVPVSYGTVKAENVTSSQIGITDLSSPGAIATTSGLGGVVEDSIPISVDPTQATSLVEKIETERVPCPRLCGAVFGKGNGGLVTFHNGEVRKMWSWFQRMDPLRESQFAIGKADLVTADQRNLRIVHNASTSGAAGPIVSPEEAIGNIEVVAKTGPRTLKELVHMMAAAKEAQWGEDNISDGESNSDDGISDGDNFFEYESLASNSSEDDEAGDDSSPGGDKMYKRYFGGQAWKGTVEKGEQATSPSATRPPVPVPGTKSRNVVGPSSDMLAPVVRISHSYDPEMLGFQRIELAKRWELGPWDTYAVEFHEVLSLGKEIQEGKTEEPQLETVVRKEGLPHYRFLHIAPSEEISLPRNKLIGITRTKSDGNIGRRYKNSHDAPQTETYDFGASKNDSRHSRGDSGRPNLEESMKFFQKLFNHQQEGGPMSFSTLVSPPDSPHRMFNKAPNRTVSTGNLKNLDKDGTLEPLNDRSEGERRVTPGPNARIGVDTLRLPKTVEDENHMREFSEIKRLCLHNAAVCAELSETEKEGVWRFLAQTVERQMEERGKQTFNGWGGDGGGALGVELVRNMLEYYERLGDSQMLATMTCVLSGGRRSTGNEGRPYLLPLDKDEKYDLYIRKYADILYAWGLLSLRTELNKHLVRVPKDEQVATQVTCPPPILNVDEFQKTDPQKSLLPGRSPGIAVVFQCPQCGQETDFNTNVCRYCDDFAFRCSLCDNAVQGLFTACDYCGHGGHMAHMMLWFANNSECPTGCGCSCTFSPLLHAQSSIGNIAAADGSIGVGDDVDPY